MSLVPLHLSESVKINYSGGTPLYSSVVHTVNMIKGRMISTGILFNFCFLFIGLGWMQ